MSRRLEKSWTAILVLVALPLLAGCGVEEQRANTERADGQSAAALAPPSCSGFGEQACLADPACNAVYSACPPACPQGAACAPCQPKFSYCEPRALPPPPPPPGPCDGLPEAVCTTIPGCKALYLPAPTGAPSFAGCVRA